MDKKPFKSAGKSTVIMPIMPMLCNKEINMPKAQVVVNNTEALAVTSLMTYLTWVLTFDVMR